MTDVKPAPNGVPTLFEWAGGTPALERLTQIFYDRVKADDLLAPVFAGMAPDHPRQVAGFIGEVFGGPKTWSDAHGEPGAHAAMIRHHIGHKLTEAQRRRWVGLMLDVADEAGLPGDPEFRSAFVAYLEWGTRLAVINSSPGATADEKAPMPAWGWGVPGGPYRG
jgi:hemoglobin